MNRPNSLFENGNSSDLGALKPVFSLQIFDIDLQSLAYSIKWIFTKVLSIFIKKEFTFCFLVEYNIFAGI